MQEKFFKCDICGKLEAMGDSEEAREEFKVNFGSYPEDYPGEISVICDDCYEGEALPIIRAINN